MQSSLIRSNIEYFYWKYDSTSSSIILISSSFDFCLEPEFGHISKSIELPREFANKWVDGDMMASKPEGF
jgi:hypothetical protein